METHAVLRSVPLCGFVKKLPERPAPGCQYLSAEAALEDRRIFLRVTCSKCKKALESAKARR